MTIRVSCIHFHPADSFPIPFHVDGEDSSFLVKEVLIRNEEVMIINEKFLIERV